MTAIWPLVLAWGLAASAPDVAKLEHFPMADIVRGQHGVCHTVFEGDTIEPFAFEVKGLMKNFLGPRKDIVLVKLLGDKPTFTGVVAGMSGSPCIIDGKLVGALSYAFAKFAEEPIGGITPIDSMLDVLHLPDEVRPWRLGLAPAQAWDQALSAQTPVDVRADNSALRPIATPITLGEAPPAVQAYFDRDCVDPETPGSINLRIGRKEFDCLSLSTHRHVRSSKSIGLFYAVEQVE